MTETDELLDRLEAFQKAWSRKKISVLSQADRKNLDFFVVTPNGNLLLDEERVSYECYCLGYFGLVGNVDITLMDALTKYRQRNEVEWRSSSCSSTCSRAPAFIPVPHWTAF